MGNGQEAGGNLIVCEFVHCIRIFLQVGMCYLEKIASICWNIMHVRLVRFPVHADHLIEANNTLQAMVKTAVAEERKEQFSREYNW